jgi:hypothetical protein
VFVKAKVGTGHLKLNEVPTDMISVFKCPDCGYSPLENKRTYLECLHCGKKWAVDDGIYDFREPLK